MSRIERSYENCEIYDNSQDHWQVYVIYSTGCKEALSKVTRIAKITKFTIIRQTSYNINEIYSKGYREVPSKVMRIAKITKFTKTAKFMIIRQTT